MAEALRRRLGEDVEVLFVGANGRMEMEKVPALGYRIVGLPMAGLQRRLDWRNLSLPFRIARSLRMARRVVREFGADVVVGFGGYASAPILRAAQGLGVPTVIQEQNSIAGLANRLLARRAGAICVAYEGMERFFPAEKIVLTGNPMRGSFSVQGKSDEALAYFGFTSDRPVLLVVGGSLGSRTFNDMMKRHIGELLQKGEVQVIWQTGKIYEAEVEAFMQTIPLQPVCRQSGADFAPTEGASERTVHTGTASNENRGGAKDALLSRQTFIERMDLAYAAADLVISRSGANTVSELGLLGKATLFVPSPNVAEDHQTRNAMALVERGAAVVCSDAEAVERAIPMALELLGDGERLAALRQNISKFGIHDSAERIVDMIVRLQA